MYFEIYGKNKNEFLNKLTNFDLRLKKFPSFSMAQTLIARLDCSIFNLKDKFLITCNRSYEDYFKERLVDLISL
jgi:sarcosine oxidase gamma subunit